MADAKHRAYPSSDPRRHGRLGYDLLTAELRAALKRMSVFAGGFTLKWRRRSPAAQLISRKRLRRSRSATLIAADRGVRPDQPGHAPIRYGMLETIRQYFARPGGGRGRA